MRPSKRFESYHGVWAWLFLAWTVCYIDRSLTGPVVSWMIQNQVGFFAEAPMEHALGGIIGSMFFAGYMLTQYPAGYLGDRYGRRWMVVISTAWAAVMTFASTFARSLTAFVALRVLTGLGEGAYYSNDRAIIDEVTPREKKGLAMGVVFVGLALGLTIATVSAPWIMDTAAAYVGDEAAWTVPFLLFSPITLLVSLGMRRAFKPKAEKGVSGWRPLFSLLLIAFVFLASIMSVFQMTLWLGWGGIEQSAAIVLLALVLVYIIYVKMGKESAPVLRDRGLVLMYISAIPILYTLWFFGYWAMLVVSESTEMGLTGSAMYAGLFGIASIIGYPLGGRMYDRALEKGRGRKVPYLVLCGSVAILVLIMAWIISSGEIDVLGLAAVLFAIGVLFSAMQTVHMTITSDLAPKGMMGQAFGMWNLVAEMGALMSPVLSGALRDWTGSWFAPTLLTSALLLTSLVLVAFVRVPRS
ncbi:MAG: MFS transporter [Euryarchaeota archaeon]|nr:MFS transporter [Euryarchaeota archaeon]